MKLLCCSNISKNLTAVEFAHYPLSIGDFLSFDQSKMLSLPPLSCFHILSFILLTLQLSTLSSAANVKSHPNSKNKRSLYVRDGIEYTRFEHLETRSTVDYVTNSGVCETTEGVNQYSGYLNVAEKGYIFFWFFEARSNPKTAPLATWNNGGPGSSSMIGLFQVSLIPSGVRPFLRNDCLVFVVRFES